jgi:hypothetical protein
MIGVGREKKRRETRVGRNGIFYLLGLALVCALVLMVDA